MLNSSPQQISRLLSQDAGMTMLRSPDSHLWISFLYRNFREKNMRSVLAEDFENALANFLQENLYNTELFTINEISPDDDFTFSSYLNKAHEIVNTWCSNEKRFLRRYYADGWIVEPTSDIERLFNWIESMTPKDFVGTESRFQNILHQLRQLREFTVQDPQKRIKDLKSRKKLIEQEIDEIEKTGIIKIFSEIEIQERLDDLAKNSRELLGDFRGVEENFQKIIQEIYQKESEKESTKGNILGYTLDTSSQMRHSPQGQSFYTFWNYMGADSENEITTILRDLKDFSEKQNFRGVDFSDAVLSHLKESLYEAGHKIVERNSILTDRINGLLLRQEQNELRQISELTSSIKEILAKIKSAKTQIKDFKFEIDGSPNLFFPMARYPVMEKKTISLDAVNLQETEISASQMKELFSQFYIDEKILMANIESYKKMYSGKQFTLGELLQHFPVTKGLAEVVAYFNLCYGKENIIVSNNEGGTEIKETVTYERGGKMISIKIPKLTFVCERWQKTAEG